MSLTHNFNCNCGYNTRIKSKYEGHCKTCEKLKQPDQDLKINNEELKKNNEPEINLNNQNNPIKKIIEKQSEKTGPVPSPYPLPQCSEKLSTGSKGPGPCNYGVKFREFDEPIIKEIRKTKGRSPPLTLPKTSKYRERRGMGGESPHIERYRDDDLDSRQLIRAKHLPEENEKPTQNTIIDKIKSKLPLITVIIVGGIIFGMTGQPQVLQNANNYEGISKLKIFQ
jgi:hypothetical protein